MSGSPNKINIVIADDYGLFRKGLFELLKNTDIEIIGEAENGEELVKQYFQLKPDVILADISMPVMSGFDALKKIKETDENVKSLFLSMYDGEEYIYWCLSSGANGLLNKNVSKNDLLNAIHKVANGGSYFGPFDQSQLDEILNKYEKKSKFEKDLLPTLTRREKTILNYIGEGLTSVEIAKALELSKRTIDSHRTHLIQKLQLRSLPDLIRYAVEYSLFQKES